MDASTTEGRLALTAYVWPDQRNRLERLRGALELARASPRPYDARVLRTSSSGSSSQDGTTTVLWHSVMWQYLPTEEQERAAGLIEALGERATERAPLVHLVLEPTRREPDRDHEFLVVMTTWPGGERRILGRGGAPRRARHVGARGLIVSTRHGRPCEGGGESDRNPGGTHGESGNEDLKAKMREALERKQSNDRGVPKDGPVKEKAHGSEVTGRRRAEDAPPQGRRRGFLRRGSQLAYAPRCGEAGGAPHRGDEIRNQLHPERAAPEPRAPRRARHPVRV